MGGARRQKTALPIAAQWKWMRVAYARPVSLRVAQATATHQAARMGDVKGSVDEGEGHMILVTTRAAILLASGLVHDRVLVNLRGDASSHTQRAIAERSKTSRMFSTGRSKVSLATSHLPMPCSLSAPRASLRNHPDRWLLSGAGSTTQRTRSDHERRLRLPLPLILACRKRVYQTTASWPWVCGRRRRYPDTCMPQQTPLSSPQEPFVYAKARTAPATVNMAPCSFRTLSCLRVFGPAEERDSPCGMESFSHFCKSMVSDGASWRYGLHCDEQVYALSPDMDRAAPLDCAF